MKLSELVACYDGVDYDLLIKDEKGVVHHITDADPGMMITTNGINTFIVLSYTDEPTPADVPPGVDPADMPWLEQGTH